MSARSSLHPGEILSKRYRIERQLATGGMGAVFEATHVATEMRVAVKVLWPQVLEQAGAVQRFQLEARVAARVASPHIVKVLDAGFDEDGELPFLVMELLSGEDLKSLVLRKGPLEPSFALGLLRQAARGLDAAHGYVDATGKPQPIIHRDLKPANLFVSDADGDAPFVRILDFGIAKVLGESMHVSTDLKGTPLYMAPEQIRGKRVFPQTDVWALGLVAYYLLTSKSFWTGAEAASPNVVAVLDEIASSPRARASARIREQGIDGVVPLAFDEWMLRCLESEPERRFPTAGEAVAALELALRGGFKLATGAPAGTAVPAHSATERAVPIDGLVADRSLTPVQGAPLQPGRSARALVVAVVAAAAVIGFSILVARPGDSPEAGDAAESAAAAEPQASAEVAPRSELHSVAPPKAEPIVASPAALPAPSARAEERERPPVETFAKVPRPGAGEIQKTTERARGAPSSPGPAAKPSAKPAATVNAFDLR